MKIKTHCRKWPGFNRIEWIAVDKDQERIGTGGTEAEAVADLMSQLADAQEASNDR